MTDPALVERNKRICALYVDEGDWSCQDLADEFGLHPGTIWRILRAAGVKMRRVGTRVR